MAVHDYIKSGDFATEKHVPVIETVDTVKAGETFHVTLSVGKDIAHPNTVEHHIEWIKLYFVAEGTQLPFEVGEISFNVHGDGATANEGPGDSELMTVKAARIVGEADIIITPKTEKKDGSVALNIASPYIQEHTEIVPVVFPMVLDDATQEEGWQEAKRIILSYLDQGKSVVFLTLGDPMFYSTYMYVYRLIENTGHEIETIPGVTAFCAIGSHLGYPIVEKEEVLAIVPATAPKEKIDAVLAVADDAVIMKVYKNFDEVQETLIKHNMADDAVMISRVGLPDEQVFVGLDNMPKDTKLNYLSTILAKRKDR